jgi:sterol desaturase/sphingolipid hydroxylase (fatty acid hydroxylase superfamily)
MRQRFRRLAYIAGGVGGLLALILVGLIWLAAVEAGQQPGARFYLVSAALTAAAIWLPNRLVRAWWHRIRHRYTV